MSEQQSLDPLHHIAISVADVAAAVSWYTTSFKCKVISQDIKKAVLEFSNTTLVLVLPSQEPPHLAFEKNNAEEFGELKSRGDGYQSTYLSDPTGNVVKLLKAI
jgi:catechol 2,3-dioxygenase-like lactoylglutathione lyase family enzyme